MIMLFMHKPLTSQYFLQPVLQWQNYDNMFKEEKNVIYDEVTGNG